MFRLDKVIKPWKESAFLNDHINLYGFWNETSFLTKSGDVGMVLGIPGVDYESLDHAEQEYAVKRLESALKGSVPAFTSTNTSSSPTVPIYRLQAMTTRSLRQRPSSGGSSSRASETISTRSKSSTPSYLKDRGQRVASARHSRNSSAILPERLANSERSSPTTA